MHLSLKRLSAALVFVGASFMPGWTREAAFTCPAGFIPKEGLNTNFPSDGLMRAFVVTPHRVSPDRRRLGYPMMGSHAQAPRASQAHILDRAG
jgi:hypothetical protein